MNNFVKESKDRDNAIKSKAPPRMPANDPLFPSFRDDTMFKTPPAAEPRKPRFLTPEEIQRNKAKNAFRAYQEKVVKALNKQRIASFGIDEANMFEKET